MALAFQGRVAQTTLTSFLSPRAQRPNFSPADWCMLHCRSFLFGLIITLIGTAFTLKHFKSPVLAHLRHTLRVPRLVYTMPKKMPTPPQSSQPARDMDTSVLDSSPEQSPRRSWKESRRPPAPEPRTTRQSSRRSRYSSAPSRSWSLLASP